MAQQFYELTTPGTPPVSLAEMKTYLRLPSACPDDDLLTSILLAATQVVEKYLGREIRANTWTLFLDEFCPRIKLRRNPVASITSVNRLVSDVLTPVASTVYYKKDHTQFSEVLLSPDQDWPTDQDEVEHAVRVAFLTAPHDCAEIAKNGIKRLVAYLYENRGDCDPTDASAALQVSGAQGTLQYLRIQRV